MHFSSQIKTLLGASLLTLSVVFAEPKGVDVNLFMQLSRPAVSVKTPAYGWLDYGTNNEVTPGFEVHYQRYGLSMSPSLWGTSRELALHPPTKFFDAKGFYYGKNWGFDLYYQYFRGFYVMRDTQSFDNSGLNLGMFTFNVYRPLTKGSRVYNMTDGISKNGIKWNFYYLLGGAYHNMETHVTLLPGLNDSDGMSLIDLRHAKTYDVFGALGVMLNTCFHGFYVDAGVFGGYGPQYRVVNTKLDRYDVTIKVGLRADAGYRNNRFGVGMDVQDDGNTLEFDERRRIGYQSVLVRMSLELFL